MEDPEKQLKLAEKIVVEGNNSDDLDRIINNEKIAAEKRKKKTQEKYRAIYRDIEILSQAKIPVYANKGKGGGIAQLEDNLLDKKVLTK